MNIPCDINSFVSGASTGGTVTISNNVATISADSGVSARLDKHILAGPGCTVEFKVFARAASGKVSVSIDYLPVDRGGDWVYVESGEWREYTVSFTTPLNSPDNQRVTFSIGSYSEDSGEGQFHSPRIKVTNTDLGASRVLGRGLIYVNAGVPSLNTSYVSDGIISVEYNPGNATLAIKLRGNYGGGIHLHPLCFAQLSMDSTSAAARKLALRTGRYDRDTGITYVQFIDCVSGVSQDITSYENIYVFFKAEI